MAKWVEQAKKDAEAIQNKDTKIAALTFELAWHKRMKFGAKAEAFNTHQRDLFNDTVAEDLQVIEAELEQLTPRAQQSRTEQNRTEQSRQGANHCRQNCRA